MRFFLPFVLSVPMAAQADAPRVITDIAPVHSLVSMVMEGVGTPELLLAQGASPHDFSLRPSHARALQQADLVIWTGADLSPWLGDVLTSLAPTATSLPLDTVKGTFHLKNRGDAIFSDDHAGHDHDGDHDDGADDAHDETHHAEGDHEGMHGAHDEHDQDGHDAEDHDEGDHGHDAHDHGIYDPHRWLDLENARLWLGAIADVLSTQDPDHAAHYRDNADRAQANLEKLETEARARLDPLRDQPFVVFHDSFQYFETHFGLAGLGAISASDATAPSPARIAALRETVAASGAACVFAEPQFSAGLVSSVTEGGDVRTAIIDPLGSRLDPGAALYLALINDLVAGFEDCLGAQE